MTASKLAEHLGVSRRLIFKLKTKYPEEAPPLEDVDRWAAFIELHQVVKSPHRVAKKSATADESNISYVAARARKTHLSAELLAIQLAATKKNVVPKEDVIALLASVGSVARGRLMKMVNDLPCAVVGLDAAAIDRIVREKVEYALAALDIRKDFFEPESLVK